RCKLCKKEYSEKNPKVRDHCHITGNYRQAICCECNINYTLPNFIPVVAHNLEGYDSHFIIRELGIDNKEIEVIAKNEEKFISFSKRLNSYNPEAKEKAESKIPKERSSAFYLKFIDSHNFLNESLSNLAKNLKD